ncbi:MAG TPA: hypothetical protein VGV59_19380 [Pyrinomonadaceae bacterium]|nr:hypothetical protein [Pyrinomonadaceae bacterium]
MSNKRILALTLAAVVAVLLTVPVKRGAAQTTLTVWLYCVSAGDQRLDCQAYPSGGSGTYVYYHWTPTPVGGYQGEPYVFIPCARAYANQTASVTVTDSNGATASATKTTYCGDAP